MKIILYLLLLLPLLAACTDNAPRKPTITVTIEPLRFFTEKIGGDKFDVVTMVPNGASPETYEPTAQQMAALTKSQLYIKAGSLGFERTWSERLKNNAAHLITVNSSEGIKQLKDNDRGISDPHTWTSPINAIHIAHNIYRALARIDVKDSAYFRDNLDSLIMQIIELDNIITAKTASAKSKSFIIYHPSLTYFANEYGLEQMVIEENGREPSAASLARLIDTAKKKNVKLMFLQKEFANRNISTITNATGVKTVEINPLSYDWEGEMLKIANAICTK